jgi:hypothetical protein
MVYEENNTQYSANDLILISGNLFEAGTDLKLRFIDT